ncbi:MAG: hypothetical protein NC305_01800 [Lachnospiraceae bacterium]|nr:hypothetical protein [Lachnospiraceae bacterium]
MLEQKDIEILQNMMESVVGTKLVESEERMCARIAESEERMNARLESRLAESEERMCARIVESEERMNAGFEKKLAVYEDLLIREMYKIQENLSDRIDKIETRLDTMQHDINACKLERESVGLLIKKIDQLECRIEELEKKTA